MTYWLANLGPIHLLTQKCLCQIWVEMINSLDTSVFQQSSIVATLPRTVTTELTNTGTDWCLDYSLYILRFIKCIIWAENRFLYRYALSIGMGKALFFSPFIWNHVGKITWKYILSLEILVLFFLYCERRQFESDTRGVFEVWK